MRLEAIDLALMVIWSGCTGDQNAEVPLGTQMPAHPAGAHERAVRTELSEFGSDIVQNTCALYVAVRSRALDRPVTFGQDLEKIDVHWNMCSTGNMIACASVPAANGDTIRTGIPWPY